MRAESAIERLILGSRWLLAPLYLALCVVLLVFIGKAAQELWHLLTHLSSIEETELILGTLSLIDLVLVANLLVMVALSSYETFVSRFDSVGEMEKPSWLGKLEPGTIKLKLAASVVSISAIHLLKSYMSHDGTSEQLLVMLGIHLGFVVSALLLAYVDRMAFSHHGSNGGH